MTVRLDEASPALFLSDLHFGDGSATDLFADQDAKLIEFLETHRERVETIVLLGDIIDMPQAWRVERVFRAHPELMRYLRDLVRNRRVIFVRGNHDWSVDYEAVFVGSTRCKRVLIGERTMAWHGHQMDLHMNPGVADATVKTYIHALAERAVGCRLVPPLERYDSTPNRIVLSLAVGWARLMQARAGVLRRSGRHRDADVLEASVRYLARSVTGDPADIFGTTTRSALGNKFDTILCGHSHVPGVVHTHAGVYANTGTWASGMRTYALWTGERFVVREVDTDRVIEDEHYASIPTETVPQDLFDWWMAEWRAGTFRSAAP